MSVTTNTNVTRPERRTGLDRSAIIVKLACPPSEVSETFVQGMANRMAVSFHKYGPVADGYPDKIDALASAWQRVERYQQTGNSEFLVDAANFMMIEFMRPRLPNASFIPTDSDSSPGRTTSNGEVSYDGNADL